MPLTVRAPPAGAVESAVTEKLAFAEVRPALSVESAVYELLPVAVWSKVTASWLPVWVPTRFPLSGENV